MKGSPGKPKDIDGYIRQFPTKTQAVLRRVRKTIRAAAPKAEEAISYGIPTFRLDGRYLIYFAGYANHVGVYPVPSGSPSFIKQLAVYRTGKGTLQFPLDKPIPYAFLARVVKARSKQLREKARKRP